MYWLIKDKEPIKKPETVIDGLDVMKLLIAVAIAALFMALFAHQRTHNTASALAPIKSEQVSAAPIKAALTASKKAIPVPQPAKWAVSTGMHGVDASVINAALDHYQAMGMSKLGASYIVGDFIQESYLNPCGQPGDGGEALGFAQWHSGRRADMPCDFNAQLDWAVNVEMQRHTPALRAALFDSNSTDDELQSLIYQWELYGYQGLRYSYAQAIYQSL